MSAVHKAGLWFVGCAVVIGVCVSIQNGRDADARVAKAQAESDARAPGLDALRQFFTRTPLNIGFRKVEDCTYPRKDADKPGAALSASYGPEKNTTLSVFRGDLGSDVTSKETFTVRNHPVWTEHPNERTTQFWWSVGGLSYSLIGPSSEVNRQTLGSAVQWSEGPANESERQERDNYLSTHCQAG